jgi:TPR repeat protein
MYLTGLGVARDQAQAHAWLAKAVDHGNDEGKAWLALTDTQVASQSLSRRGTTFDAELIVHKEPKGQ